MKRKISLALALVIAIGLFVSGCGTKSVGELEGTSNLSGVNEFPITKEPKTLRIFSGKSIYMEELESNAFTKAYEEKTGVKLEMDYVSGDVRQAINLKIASGDYGDVFMGFDLAKSEQLSYHNQGVFADMTELVEKNGFYIKKMFEEQPQWLENVKHGTGKILGLPNGSVDYSSQYPYVCWVYKPWMEKLGLEMPETTEDFYNMLKAFKEKDPNGNGVADEIPLAGRNLLGNPVGIDTYILDAYTMYSKYGLAIDDNDKVYFSPITPEFKEGIKFLRKLYSESLLHMDSFIMDRTRIMALAENETPILGAAPSCWTTQFTVAGSDTGRYNEYVAIPPLKGPGGVRHTLKASEKGITSHFNITETSENKDLAMKWIDWFYSPEAYLTNTAPIGTREAKEGELGLDGKQAMFAVDSVESTNSGNTLQNERWMTYAPGYSPIEFLISTAVNTSDKKRSENAYAAYELYAPYATDRYLSDFYVPEDTTDEYLDLRSAITSEVQAAITTFTTGERSIDDEWDDYVETIRNLNVDRYVEIAQEYLDSLN